MMNQAEGWMGGMRWMAWRWYVVLAGQLFVDGGIDSLHLHQTDKEMIR